MRALSVEELDWVSGGSAFGSGNRKYKILSMMPLFDSEGKVCGEVVEVTAERIETTAYDYVEMDRGFGDSWTFAIGWGPMVGFAGDGDHNYLGLGVGYGIAFSNNAPGSVIDGVIGWPAGLGVVGWSPNLTAAERADLYGHWFGN